MVRRVTRTRPPTRGVRSSLGSVRQPGHRPDSVSSLTRRGAGALGHQPRRRRPRRFYVLGGSNPADDADGDHHRHRLEVQLAVEVRRSWRTRTFWPMWCPCRASNGSGSAAGIPGQRFAAGRLARVAVEAGVAAVLVQRSSATPVRLSRSSTTASPPTTRPCSNEFGFTPGGPSPPHAERAIDN